MSVDLVIVDGPEAGRRIPISTAPVTLGRAPAAALAFPDDGFISSVHLSIHGDADGVQVTDLRSTNGTFLNGERITSAHAGIGDVIQVGTMSMQVAAALQPSPAQNAAPVFSSQSAPPASSVALPRMDIPEPPAFSPSVVATTTIPRIAFDGSELFRRAEAPPRQPEVDVVIKRLQEKLASQAGSLFVLVNAAADESISAILSAGDVDLPSRALWKDGAVPARWTPYLVPIASESPLLNVLLEKGWGKNWLTLLVAPATVDELIAHFSKFLKVQMDGTGGVYFRFYDPAVLRDFLPSGSQAEVAMFFGPIQKWFLEGLSRTTLTQASFGPAGLLLESTQLSA